MSSQKSVATHWNFKSQSSENNVFVYRALQQLRCSQCNRIIKVSELFTRSADKKGQIYDIRYTHCRDCVPFESILQKQ